MGISFPFHTSKIFLLRVAESTKVSEYFKAMEIQPSNKWYRTITFYFNQGWNTELQICYRFIIYCFNISFSLLVLEAMEKEKEV